MVLSTELTPELVTEGWARELVHAIQNRRKDLECDYTDRIAVGVDSQAEEIERAVRDHRDYICAETLGHDLRLGSLEDAEAVELSIAGAPLKLYVKRLPAAGPGSQP